jgi:hypothetical protein
MFSAKMLQRAVYSLIIMFGFYGPAQAAPYDYDWSFSGTFECGLGPGCSGVPQPQFFSEAGTFTSSTNLGLSGILTTSDLLNIISYTNSDLFDAVSNSSLASPLIGVPDHLVRTIHVLVQTCRFKPRCMGLSVTL